MLQKVLNIGASNGLLLCPLLRRRKYRVELYASLTCLVDVTKTVRFRFLLQNEGEKQSARFQGRGGKSFYQCICNGSKVYRQRAKPVRFREQFRFSRLTAIACHDFTALNENIQSGTVYLQFGCQYRSRQKNEDCDAAAGAG